MEYRIDAKVIQRFWRQVNKDGPLHPKVGRCWVWTGNNWYGRGYCQFDVENSRVAVHKFSWLIHFGLIPKDKRICHKCDNVRCVNPSHLFMGTDLDNATDKVRKGRQAKGEMVKQSHLTCEDVREIRRIYIRMSREFGTVALGRRYEVSAMTINEIILRQTWKHVG